MTKNERMMLFRLAKSVNALSQAVTKLSVNCNLESDRHMEILVCIDESADAVAAAIALMDEEWK